MISLEPGHNPVIFTYDRGNGKIVLVLQGLDLHVKDKARMQIDTYTTRNQTIVLWADGESEVVLELRPRRLSRLETAKITALLKPK